MGEVLSYRQGIDNHPGYHLLLEAKGTAGRPETRHRDREESSISKHAKCCIYVGTSALKLSFTTKGFQTFIFIVKVFYLC